MTPPPGGPTWVAGVDGGGTRTRVVILDGGGAELGRSEGAPSLADPTRPGAAAAVLRDVVLAAARAAGVTAPAAALWAGIAGVGREETRAAVEAALADGDLALRVTVGTDVEAAYHDAFADDAGLLLVAGTGSIGWGRSEDGRVARVGGWGSWLGDEGSGWAIGLAALRSVARAVDGRGPATGLERLVQAHLGLDGADALVPWVARATKAEVAALAPLVAQAAAAGDGVAAAVLADAVDALDAHVDALLVRLGPWTRLPAVGLTGGLIAPGGPLRPDLEARVRARGLDALKRAPDAARGAAHRALVMIGAPPAA